MVICTVLPVSPAINDDVLLLNSINSKRKLTESSLFTKHPAFLCIKAEDSRETYTLISISVRGIKVIGLAAYKIGDI